MTDSPAIVSRIVLVAFAGLLLLLSPPVSAFEGSFGKTVESLSEQHRKLDAAYTLPPSKEPTPPTPLPTAYPTHYPTPHPTPRPTPTDVGNGPPDICGTIPHGDGSGLILGLYEDPSWLRTPDYFDCDLKRSGHWYHQTGYGSSNQYLYQITKRCEYMFSGPETNMIPVELRDVNDFFEQMAISLRRPGTVSYKHSSDDIVYSGYESPDYDDDVEIENIAECPEDYCIKVTGSAVTRRSLGASYPTYLNTDGNTENLSILYTFSSWDAWDDFRWKFRDATRSRNKHRIFHTNHFRRCNCDSFCMEDDKHWDNVPVPATCYTEDLCGQRVYKIQYESSYPENEKASWASTGTTQPMVWFDECAKAMYGCAQITNFDMNSYHGTYDDWNNGNYKGYPKIFSYGTYQTEGNPYLVRISGNPTDHYPLGPCQGDCDYDEQCQEGLLCFQRSNWETVPGCNNDSADKSSDYCYSPGVVDANLPALRILGDEGIPAEVYPLGLCEGECDSDSDCAGDLQCYQRSGYEAIPGCAGGGLNKDDYCYDPNSVVSPTWTPTSSPSMSTYNHAYGLGGDKYYGFRTGATYYPSILWSCPSADHLLELENFGAFVEETQYFRSAGTDETVPDVPCPDPYFYYPAEPPVYTPTWSCDNVEPNVFCFEMEGATCYAKTDSQSCIGVEFVMINATSTYTFDDVFPWHDACIASGNQCHRVPGYETSMDGYLTYVGMPLPHPTYAETTGVVFNLLNRKIDGRSTVKGNNKVVYYHCDDWNGAFASKNFTYGAGDYGNWFENDYGDLYNTICTASPSTVPSDVPTSSSAPSSEPSQQPTFCTDSYLTSEDLNIALVMDTSYSTYEKTFSATNPVGDINNDGKANTILDAQVAAIQQLLEAIADSPSLQNSNTEINLISFDTGATDHGKWDPLDSTDELFNPLLMDKVKDIRAPLNEGEVQANNNGFTNFDAALDVAADYFLYRATPNRKNLLVFMSDGEPNVRGDGDNEGYCDDYVNFWKEPGSSYACSDLNILPGQEHTFCLANDTSCSDTEKYQDCVRGPNNCMNGAAATQYDSEIGLLNLTNTERLAIGIGGDSNVEWGSGLWIIDNNPAKWLGRLPLQALDLDELTDYLSSLCILDTYKPTGSPSVSPSAEPTKSAAPSSEPSGSPSKRPTATPTKSPTARPSTSPTDNPTESTAPTGAPIPSPSASPTDNPTTEFQSACEAPEGGNFYLGQLNMCLRSSLGYLSPNTGAYFEVNFIETLIRIDYDVSTGFCVLDFAVAPKERELTTISESLGGLEAYLCDPDTLVTESTPLYSRQVPVAVTEYDTPGNTATFNQGALITVCVRPDGESYDEGLVMDEILDFAWIRDPHPLYPDVIDPLSQSAILNNAQSGNFLTAYVPSSCYGQGWCSFSSVLFAEFYYNSGEAGGTGSASLTWDTNFNPTTSRMRRLLLEDDRHNDDNEEEEEERRRRRRMQFDPDPPAPSGFDAKVYLIGQDEAPNLKDSGGARPFSLKWSTLGAMVGVIASLGAGALGWMG